VIRRSPLVDALLFGATLSATACAVETSDAAPAPSTHTYFIAADEVEWDYAPDGMNEITGKPFGEAEAFWVETGPHKIGRVYTKAIYREYTDETFTTLKSRPPEWEHLGALGPLIRASVGDTIRVVFRNNVPFATALHPHGVFYDKDSEGAPYADGTAAADRADDGVAPGETHTYVWPVPERAGPSPDGPSSAFWMYHSHVDEVQDVNAGLIGPMIITARGRARPDGTPDDVDREFVVSFHEMFENESYYIQQNLHAHASDAGALVMTKDPFGSPLLVQPADPAAVPDYNLMESMNGFVYGNVPGLVMRQGERVRWYVMGTTNFEVHAPHWHGNTVEIEGMRSDVASLVTMGMIIADMTPDNPGTWLFHCHVAPHLEGGMSSLYTVQPVDATTTD
jgi:FtsP/CotA-like multicopper oxidase with cupredoxin domain